MKIEVNHFSSSRNVLQPIIHFMYYNPEYTNNLDGIKAYLIRVVLFTCFQLGITSKLQQMNDPCAIDGKIDDIIDSEKGSRVDGEALYSLGVD